MGHRLSKSNWTSSSSSSRNLNQDSTNCNKQSSSSSTTTTTISPPTVQILSISKHTDNNVDQRFLTIDQDLQIESAAATIAGDQDPTAAPTRFIIRIQLTKMEPGNNNNQLDNNNSTITLAASIDNENRICTNLDNNLNINRPINNFTIPKNIICDAPSTIFTPTTSSSSSSTTTTTSIQNDLIANDSRNEIKLNNLNRTLSIDNANSLRNFTNNFTTNRGSLCLNNDEHNTEQDVGNFVGHYAPCTERCNSNSTTPWAAAVRTNNFNDINNRNNNNNNNNVESNSNCNCNGIINISTLPITNQNCNTATMNLSTSCNCSTILQDGQNNVALCYNQFATNSIPSTAEGHTISSGGDDRNDHDRRKKSSSPYPPNLGFHLVRFDSSKKSSTTSPTSSSSSSSSDSKESSPASSKALSAQSNNKRSWTTKFNCTTRRDSSSSGSERQQPENNDISGPCVQQNCIHTTLIVLSPHFLVGPLDDGGRQQHSDCLQAVTQPGQQTPRIQGAQINSNQAFRPAEYNPDHFWQLPQRLTVHSQADYIHCLVPDLEKITSSSFYWGKMDRYEAERLLEGKPEGTFLLRDSAQEEYLFSVTFRKYGRSLHARIEQFNHKFSFDCHDPGVFTAPTVTGLLEHYKDPSCVMFFEPMLTIPLHRKFSFSLQQLCRATIVSNIHYDGINELQLPNSLKAYLKEYHYKYRIRVKPCDNPLYTSS